MRLKLDVRSLRSRFTSSSGSSNRPSPTTPAPPSTPPSSESCTNDAPRRFSLPDCDSESSKTLRRRGRAQSGSVLEKLKGFRRRSSSLFNRRVSYELLSDDNSFAEKSPELEFEELAKSKNLHFSLPDLPRSPGTQGGTRSSSVLEKLKSFRRKSPSHFNKNRRVSYELISDDESFTEELPVLALFDDEMNCANLQLRVISRCCACSERIQSAEPLNGHGRSALKRTIVGCGGTKARRRRRGGRSMSTNSSADKLEEVRKVIKLYLETKERLERDLEATVGSTAYHEELEEVVSKISELRAHEKLQIMILQKQGYDVDLLSPDGLADDQSSASRKLASGGPLSASLVPSHYPAPSSPLARTTSEVLRTHGYATESVSTELDRRSRQHSGDQHDLPPPPHSPVSQDPPRLSEVRQRPPSPMKNHLRVFMPNNQRTMVIVARGKTVREALAKKMQTRSLRCDMCQLQRSSDHAVIDWDKDTSELDGQELMLTYLPEYSFRQRSIPHVIVRKTFFRRIAYCDYCHGHIFQGYTCDTCDIKFHARCAASVSEVILPLSNLSYSCCGG